VPNGYYKTPIGKARIAQKGQDATVISYGTGVHWALKIAQQKNLDIEIIDLRTLLPWDKDTVFNSVKKTGRCLVVHEDTLTGGIGAEIAAWVAENLFQYLDAPVMRSASLDTPIPFNSKLEQQFLNLSELEKKIQDLLSF
jgi:2-oxoisovalerate dehydrogenase E1 component